MTGLGLQCATWHGFYMVTVVSLFAIYLPIGANSNGQLEKVLMESECGSQLRHLQGNEAVREVSPPKLKGEWVSTRCEVRPGPEFLTRRYKFHHDNTFSLHLFFYSDHYCRTPAFTYKVRGTLSLQGDYLMLQGATEADYVLDKVVLLVYQEQYAKTLSKLLNRTCPGNHFPGTLELFQKYVIFDWTRDDLYGDCIDGVAFTMHELQLLRQEFHTEFDTRTAEFVSWEELFLGDIHTDSTQKIYHRPKTYQIPLRKYQTNCSTCQVVHNADEFSPPILPRKTEYEVTLQGEFVSTRCEVRQIFFLIRHIIFHRNYTWEAYYHYYSDPNCQHPEYSMYVKGDHTMAVHSLQVPGGTEYDFKTSEMWLTPHNKAQTQILNLFNENNCALRNSWKLNKPQDVTSTGGCAALGVELPHTEYELMRMEADSEGSVLLFTGQRPTVTTSPNSQELRPTSYQSPLKRCAGLNPLLHISVTDGSGESSAAFISSSVFIIVLTFLSLLFVQH